MIHQEPLEAIRELICDAEALAHKLERAAREDVRAAGRRVAAAASELKSRLAQSHAMSGGRESRRAMRE
jgi:hypothetical protein